MAEQNTVRKSNTASSSRTAARSASSRSEEPVSRAARTKQMQERRRRKIHSRAREITMLVVLGVLAIGFVSCFVESMSWLKDFNYFLFGKMMYLAPFAICVITYFFLYAEVTPELVKRIAGILIALFAIHGIISIAGTPEAGGLPGKLMDLAVRSWLGNVGSIIIYVMMLAISFILLTDFSYYLRCKLFHANRPVELFSFSDDLEIKVLRIVNGLLEEFLDANLIRIFY